MAIRSKYAIFLSMLEGSEARGLLCSLSEALAGQGPAIFGQASTYHTEMLSQNDPNLMHNCKLPSGDAEHAAAAMTQETSALAMLSICFS